MAISMTDKSCKIFCKKRVQTESCWDAQRVERVKLLKQQRGKSKDMRNTVSKRRRRWYLPLVIDDGDIKRGFYLPRAGEPLRDMRAQRYARSQGARVVCVRPAARGWQTICAPRYR